MLGVFGGTFDPIHYGHLRSVRETARAVGLEQVILTPCGHPAHRARPHASAAHRLRMVRLAAEEDPLFHVDEREAISTQPCRTVTLLTALRRDYADSTLCLIMGQDSFLTLTQWYQWEQLFRLAHIIVMSRPDVPEPTADEVWRSARPACTVAELHEQPHGLVLRQTVTRQPISASAVRLALVAGRPVDHLIPRVVKRYIDEHRLYA